MVQMTIQDQQYLINRVKKFLEKYGVSKKWLASKVGIAEQRFSYFCNSRFAIPRSQYDRLMDFLDEYDKRLVGFAALDN